MSDLLKNTKKIKYYRISDQFGTRNFEKILNSYQKNTPRLLRSLKWVFYKRISIVLIQLKSLHPKTISLVWVQLLQQFAHLLQKKFFTKKLWAYYNLKNFQNWNFSWNHHSQTFYTHKSDSPSYFKPFQTYHTDQNFQTAKLVKTVKQIEKVKNKESLIINNQIVGVSKLGIVVNNILQKLSTETFWMIYLFQGHKKNFLKNKNLRPECFWKIEAIIKNVHNSEKAAGILSSFVLKKTRQNLKYSFEVILNYYFVKCKSIKRISAFVVNFVYRLKEKSFLSIKKYSESWIFKQKFSDFLFWASFIQKKTLGVCFDKIKEFSKQKSLSLFRTAQILKKHSNLQLVYSFVCMKKFANSIKIHRVTKSYKHTQPRLITLPTIFLEGDPGGLDIQDLNTQKKKKRISFINFN